MSPIKQQLLEAIEDIPDNQIESLLAIVERWKPHQPIDPAHKPNVLAILEQLAQLTPSIPDPIAWQNDLRSDRNLPGRLD